MNGLKYINDTFGHKEGDYAITSAAKIIEKVTGRQGICARFGGDEYLAVVVSMTEDKFIRSAGSEIEHINRISGKPYGISVSLFVICFIALSKAKAYYFSLCFFARCDIYSDISEH